MMQRLANVEGKASMKVLCDTVKFVITAQSQDVSLETATETTRGQLDSLISDLADNEIVPKTEWQDPEYERLTEQTNTMRRGVRETSNVFVGFRATQSLALTLAWNPEQLCKVLILAEKHNLAENISTTAFVANPAPHRDEATRQAVANAKHYATVVCEAAGAKLGELVNVNPKNCWYEYDEEPELCVEDLLVCTHLEVDEEPMGGSEKELDRTISIMTQHLLKSQPSTTYGDEVKLQFSII